jgi:N-acyl-D-amino-acid deacylase
MYDLVVRNGNVIDGTGSAGYRADVAVSGGEIVAIGRLEGQGTSEIDAAGQVVCPGFIDLHTHSDMSFLLDSTAQSKVRQGVTLELAGNCGSSFCAPLSGDSGETIGVRLSQYKDAFQGEFSLLLAIADWKAYVKKCNDIS